MPIHRHILTLFITVVSAVQCFGIEVADADSAYRKGNYEEAAVLYNQLIEHEGLSAGLLYNLGNTYYRMGKDGEAMLCYERANKLDSGNETIEQNLNFLRNKVNEANKSTLQGKNVNVEPEEETFLDKIYSLIAIEHQSNGWAVFAVMAFILFLGAMAMYMFTPNVLARKTGFFSGIAFFIFTSIFILFAFLSASQYEKADEAILIDFTTELLQQPDNTSQPATTPLHRGTKLKILETRKGADGTEWLKVKLNPENVGWVKKEGIEVI